MATRSKRTVPVSGVEPNTAADKQVCHLDYELLVASADVVCTQQAHHGRYASIQELTQA